MTNTIISAFEVIAGGVLKPSAMAQSFDQSELAPHIEDAENRYLRPIFGDTFYDYLVANKLTDSCNYNTDKGAYIFKFGDLAVIDPPGQHPEHLWTKHLHKLCAYIVMQQALPFIGVKTTNKGVMTNNDEFATNIGTSGVKFLQQEMMQNINYRIDNMKNYLEKYKADFKDLGYGVAEECESEKQINNLGIIFH